MLVKELMTENVECVRPSDNLSFVADRMRERDIGSMPVCGERDRLVGVITDRDITVRATANSLDPTTTIVKDVMTPQITYCFEDDEASEAAQHMVDHQIRRLPVLSREKRLVGILSLGDLAVETGDAGLAGTALVGISSPSHAEAMI